MTREQGSEWYSAFKSSETVLIAMLPVAGGLLAFCFEAGYLWHYNVPLSFMRIDLVRVAVASVVTLLVIFGLLAYLKLAIYIFRRGSLVRLDFAARLVSLSLVAVLVSFIEIPFKWWFFGVCAGCSFLVAYIPPLFRRGKNGSYRLALEASIQPSADDTAADPRLDRIKTGASFGFIACFFVAAAGVLYAQEKRLYLVVEGHESKVLVEAYSDTAVLVGFDPATNLLRPEITLLRLTDGEVSFRRERIGPLNKEHGRESILPP